MNTNPPDEPQKPNDSLESCIQFLPPEFRERIVQIARKSNLPDNDPIWTVVWTLREGDKLYIDAVQAIQQIAQEFQAIVYEASKTLADTGKEQERILAETKEILTESRAMASEATSKLITSEESCEKTSRWALILASAAVVWSLYIGFLVAGCVCTLGAIQTERHNLVDAINHVAEMQRLAGYRTQLTNERAELEVNWKQLQKAATEQGMTPQLEATKTELEGIHAAITRKQHELLQLEKKTYEN